MTRLLNLPGGPLLLPGVGGSSDPAAELRRVCRRALAESLEPGIRRVIMIAPGARTTHWDPTLGYDLGRLTGRDTRPPRPGDGLPLPLAVGRSLLDAALAENDGGRDSGGPELIMQTVAADTTADALGELADGLGCGPADLVITIGDGSALGRPGGPDRVHPRADEFDRDLVNAWRSGDPAALAALDAELATAVMATGLPAWRAAAAIMASAGGPYRAEIDHAEAAFGVLYLIARWQPT